MDDRIQTVLDGELARNELTASESAELAVVEAAITAALRSVPTATLPDLGPAVLRRIRKAESQHRVAPPAVVPRPSAVSSVLDWIWQPRRVSFRWRPAYGLAAAAVLVVAVMGRDAPPAAHQSNQVLTQFLLSAPDAREVTLAGDFTDWQPAYSLTRSEPGVWTVVVPLEPGIHNYAFVVDGEHWVADPAATAVEDGFGGLNSRLAVLAPDEEVR